MFGGEDCAVRCSRQERPANADEHYRTAHVVLPLSDNLHLELDSKEVSGKFCAAEGNLKATVSSSMLSRTVIAARSASRPRIVRGASAAAERSQSTCSRKRREEKQVTCSGRLLEFISKR